MRRILLSLAAALAVLALTAPGAGAFGLNGFDVVFEDEDGTAANRAGAHPFAITTSFATDLDGSGTPEGWFRDVFLAQAPGLVGDTTAYERCTNAEFLQIEGQLSACPEETALGVTAVSATAVGSWYQAPVYTLTPPPGVPLRLGFTVAQANIVIDVTISTSPPHNAIAASRNTSQILEFIASKTQLWGEPSDPGHDELRGPCGFQEAVALPSSDPAEYEFLSAGSCESDDDPPLLTAPTECAAPLLFGFEAFSWEGGFDSGFVESHDDGANPVPLSGCESLPPLDVSLAARPTSRAAHSPTGLDLGISVADEGLLSRGGTAASRIREVRIALPEGMTANPSLAEGLEVCSQADLGRETLASEPGEGCPQAAKIGTVEVRTPLVDQALRGALYQATPYANLADDSLLAFYIVLKSPELGILVKQASRVEPDPATGQLVGIAEDIPQLPFSDFQLRFREGARSPLASPPLCGSYEVGAEIVPWSGQAARHAAGSFEVISGPGGSPCPPAGTPPFEPGFEAGTLSNAAARHSTLALRLTRRDGDQDLTRFDAELPPGLTAKLAGVSRCPEAQIAIARQKSGRAELASPACPANSRIGTIKSGAGVGPQLTYVPGSLYLAGPFAGAPASVLAVVPAVAGPFDIGTVVVRQALRIDPRSGRASVDGSASDPIPHILAGIPLLVRDIQALVDRPGFALNPTSCDPSSFAARIWGGGEQLFSAADDSPVSRSARYQASSCRSLGFAPRIAMRLRGGTRRGAFPALRLVYRPRPGQANLRRLALRFPRSEFIEQGHFRTICTRVRFAAGAGFGQSCPKGSVYGRARVFTPLLDEPLEGPVYLRSSNNNLPDAVLALHGPASLPVKVEVPVRIDSVKGGLRTIATALPDLPVSRAIVRMQGGQKGLFVNSTDICARAHRANLRLAAHNAKRRTLRPQLRAQCNKKRRARSSHRRVR